MCGRLAGWATVHVMPQIPAVQKRQLLVLSHPPFKRRLGRGMQCMQHAVRDASC